jgi:hypothetical protein
MVVLPAPKTPANRKPFPFLIALAACKRNLLASRATANAECGGLHRSNMGWETGEFCLCSLRVPFGAKIAALDRPASVLMRHTHVRVRVAHPCPLRLTWKSKSTSARELTNPA